MIVLILLSDFLLICIGWYGLYKIKARFKENERVLDNLETSVASMQQETKQRIVKVKRQTIYFKEKK